jgi:hypothetical protein
VVAVFGLAAAAGAGVGPLDVGASSVHSSTPDHTDTVAQGAELSGLSVAADGFQLVPDVVNLTANEPSSFTFHIETSKSSALTEFDELHERRLHLIVLSRNLIDYLHLHPSMDSNGSWQVDLPPLAPGSYRAYADFQATGADRVTLGTDLQVAGLVPAADLPAVSSTDESDGYQVTLSALAVVGASPIEFSVVRDGKAITTDPYLGAAGHLVVIRSVDLGYLHVHPIDGTDGTVRFAAEFPTPGTYRLFFDFAHGDAVHTASFTIEVPTSRPVGTTSTDTMTDHEGD